MSSHFGNRLCEAVRAKKTALTVGLDPVYNRLPPAITSHRQMNDEFDAAAAVDAIFDFCTQTMRVVAPMVPAIKINVAYFEKYLWEGLETYYALISEAILRHGNRLASAVRGLPDDVHPATVGVFLPSFGGLYGEGLCGFLLLIRSRR